MRSTIKDVAQLANVSTATVSNVHTGAKNVSEELRTRILWAMEVLGYEPNVVARSLKINKTFRIGIIVPDITNPFFSEIVKEIDTAVSKKNYQLVLFSSDYDVKKEFQFYASLVMGNGVDGLIMVAPRMEESQFKLNRSIPLLVVDRPAFFDGISDIAFVYADNYAGAYLMASLLLKKKYKRFACIAGPETVPNANARYEGFKAKLTEAGYSSNEIEVIRREFSFIDGYEAMMKLLEGYDPAKQKMAVFACSDISAWGAIEAVNSKGLMIPEDIGIAGYDNIYFAKFIQKGLTTIENPTKDMGGEAGELMLERLSNNRPFESSPVILESSLKERETV